MKKIIILLLIATGLTACKDRTKFTIKGTLENAEKGSKIFFYGLDSGGVAYTDSTVLSEKGEFLFSHVSKKPSVYSIAYADKDYVVVAENGDVIRFKADLKAAKPIYEIEGSESSEKLMNFNKMKEGFEAEINKLNIEYKGKFSAQNANQDALTAEFLTKFKVQLDKINDEVLKFAKDNVNSGLSDYAYNFITIKEGLKAPDFTLYSIDGKTVSLSDYKGKYLLLDIWASWCMPCRAENPNVVKAYNTYKDKNFTVLGVSIDKDMETWKNAVKADNLTWQHGSDLGDWNSLVIKLYHLSSIPASFIIDPQGRIVARDLRGEALQQFLQATLK